MVNATSVKLGGGVQVSLSLLEELRGHPEHSYAVLLSPQVASVIDRDQFGTGFHFATVPGNVTSIRPDGWRARAWLRQQEERERPDAVLTVFGPSMWKPRAPHLVGFANGVFLSLAPRFIREHHLAGSLRRLRFLIRRAMLLAELRRESGHFWVETEAARADLSRVLRVEPAQVAVVSNSYGTAFRDLGERLDRPREPGPFRLLCLATYYPHKNLELIRDVLPLLRARGLDVEFLMTMGGDDYGALFGGCEGVRNLGPLRPSECPDAYLLSDAVFFPSLLETFSAVYPEAMVTRRAIMTSDLPFARSVCDDAALYFDPYDATSACQAIERVIRDEELRADLVRRGTTRLRTFDDAAGRCAKLLALVEGLATAERRGVEGRATPDDTVPAASAVERGSAGLG